MDKYEVLTINKETGMVEASAGADSFRDAERIEENINNHITPETHHTRIVVN